MSKHLRARLNESQIDFDHPAMFEPDGQPLPSVPGSGTRKKAASLLRSAITCRSIREGLEQPEMSLQAVDCPECSRTATVTMPGVDGPICGHCLAEARSILEEVDAGGFDETGTIEIDWQSTPVRAILGFRRPGDTLRPGGAVVVRRPEVLPALREGRRVPVPSSGMMCGNCGARPIRWSVVGAREPVCDHCWDDAVEVVKLLDEHQQTRWRAATERRKELAGRHHGPEEAA